MPAAGRSPDRTESSGPSAPTQQDTLVVLMRPVRRGTTVGVRVSRVDTTHNDACLEVGLRWKQHTAHEDGDGVLAQFGTYDFRGVREFSADLTRQFQESGDQDAPLWQRGCTIYWAPTPENSALASGHLWSFGMDLDDFFAEALTLQAGHGP